MHICIYERIFAYLRVCRWSVNFDGVGKLFVVFDVVQHCFSHCMWERSHIPYGLSLRSVALQSPYTTHFGC